MKNQTLVTVLMLLVFVRGMVVGLAFQECRLLFHPFDLMLAEIIGDRLAEHVPTEADPPCCQFSFKCWNGVCWSTAKRYVGGSEEYVCGGQNDPPRLLRMDGWGTVSVGHSPATYTQVND